MTEPAQNDPWSSLADQLGVDASKAPEPPPPAAPAPPIAAASPQPKPAPAPRPRPKANWRALAGELGVEVPPEPEPQVKPPPPAVKPVRGAAESREPPTRRQPEVRGSDEAAPRREHERQPERERGHGRTQDGERGEHRPRGRRGGGRGEGRPSTGRRDDRPRARPAGGERGHREDRGERRRDDEPRDREPAVGGLRESERHERVPREQDQRALSETRFEGEPEAHEQEGRLTLEESATRGPIEGDESPPPVRGGEEPAGSTRRRRRRRGRRGVLREDAVLGIERLATEDIVEHIAAEDEPRREAFAEPSLGDEDSFGEEITSVEVGEEKRDDEDGFGAGEAPRKRRRRRRGRRPKEGAAAERDLDETAEGRPQREPRPARAEKPRHADADEVDEDDEDEEDLEGVSRPSKNLHRECTPWAEAIGFIVDANMEARARNPGGGGQRGRWGKGDRRS